MTLYIQPYSFGFAQEGPFRRTARRWVEQPQQRSLGVNIREEEDPISFQRLCPG